MLHAALALLVAAGAQEERGEAAFRGSEAAVRLASEGWVVAGERLADLYGDGAAEAIVVEGQLGPEGPDPQRVRLSVYERGDPPKAGGPRPWKATFTSPAVTGSRASLLEVRPLGCGGKGLAVLAELVDERPDEIRRTILAYAGLPRSPSQLLRFGTTSGHRDPSLVDVSFADQRLGVTAHDLDGDGVLELFLHHEPTLLPLVGPTGEAREALVGYRQRAFRCEGGRYRTAKERYVDLLRPVGAAPGLAGDGAPATGTKVRAGDRLRVDAKLGTTVRAVRLVPGCGATAAAWKQSGEVRRARLHGLAPSPIDLDLDAPVPARGQPVRAAGVVPLPGAPWARQALVVAAAAAAGPLELEVLATDAAGGCVGELAAY